MPDRQTTDEVVARSARVLPSGKDLEAVESACSAAFTQVEFLQVRLEGIVGDWYGRRPEDADVGQIAPAAGPTLADIGAIYACLEFVRTELHQMQDTLGELDATLSQLDAMRRDLLVVAELAGRSDDD